MTNRFLNLYRGWQSAISYYDDDGKPKVNIPVLYVSDMELLSPLINKAQEEFTRTNEAPLREFLIGKKKELPAHLISVPLQKQYMHSDSAMLMSALRLAMKKGLVYDGDYDNAVQCPYPMMFGINR